MRGGWHHGYAAKADDLERKGGRTFGKQDFRYVADEDVYVCPAGEKLAYSFTTQDKGMVLRRYRTTACHSCAIKNSCTKGKERLISRWEHEHILEHGGRHPNHRTGLIKSTSNRSCSPTPRRWPAAPSSTAHA